MNSYLIDKVPEENSAEILVQNGIHISLYATNDGVLYKSKSSIDKEKELIVLPYSMETNDISLCMSQDYTGQQYGQTLIYYIEQ
ncbi:unnamed protein product [Adineta steineri]|uniref:Uncharacterized protein n=1 Tax=Adineta steineri TaxID=433720 RepID=A0A819WVE1_9BILA|nr:unnamed protein product [Adineta steineri]CAF4127193.1 unnamed protein product [Adineta steineri]